MVSLFSIPLDSADLFLGRRRSLSATVSLSWMWCIPACDWQHRSIYIPFEFALDLRIYEEA